MKLLSLDLSTTSTGYAVFRDNQLESSGTIALRIKDWKERIKEIYQIVYHLILKEKHPYEVIEVVTEKPLSLQNGDTTIKLAKLHGLILSICFQEKIELYEIDNQTWKKHIAGAKASKEQTKKHLEIFYQYKTETFDEADAIGVGLGWMAEQRLKEKMEKYAPVKRMRKSRKAA
ncbi:MAG TPA: crossover junction endodeoxyribonuclease RuvC [Atribacterota bacterium]|nr:crossover junction endodeoxyribonuclease RuvC [Atribacterota bacterium]